MRAIGIRLLALVVACVASVILPGPAGAQGKPDSTGFIGIPEYTSSETGIPFFFQENSERVDGAFRAMRDAIAKCDRAAYEDARDRLVATGYRVRRAGGTGDSANRIAQANRDEQNYDEAFDKAPPFPKDCTPPSITPRSTGSKFGYFELVAIGGGMIPLNGAGAVTGVDTFFGAGAYLVDNRTSTSGNATAFAGARIRAQTSPGWMKEREAEELDRATQREAIRDSFRLFAETGIQTAFGAQSSLQTFQNVSGTPQAFGSSTINENLQIPILVGVTVPIMSGSASKPAVLFDLYGGITLDSWTQTLQGRESGAPGGSGFFGQNRRFTVDPTVGVGVRVPVGDIGGLPGITVGVNAELQFRPGSVVTAPSANFPSETYYGTANPTANMAIMGRIGIPLGGK